MICYSSILASSQICRKEKHWTGGLEQVGPHRPVSPLASQQTLSFRILLMTFCAREAVGLCGPGLERRALIGAPGLVPAFSGAAAAVSRPRLAVVT